MSNGHLGTKDRDACPAENWFGPDRLIRLTEERLFELTRDLDPAPSSLTRAAQAAVLGPGKRVRSVLAMLAAAEAGAAPETALDLGCAVEMVHAASLALDDLPCMDNAEFRRGRATVHRDHGEDAAILAAVALLNEAQRVILLAPRWSDAQRLLALEELTAVIGFRGLAAGQMRDLRDPTSSRTEDGLRSLNHLKTGTLFVAVMRGGARLAGAGPARLEAFTAFGGAIGYAFQLADDLRDVVSTVAAEGKNVGQDRTKRTFVDLWGSERVRTEIRTTLTEAQALVGVASPLNAYVQGLFRRVGLDG
jgi:geranylgeranyl diphosphate synthase type II